MSVALHGSAAHSVALKTAAENSTTPPMSSSRINSVAELRPATSCAPAGPLSARFTDSVTSPTLSCRIGTVNVRVRTVVAVPPGANVSVPDGGVSESRIP